MLWFVISKTNRQGRNTKAITRTQSNAIEAVADLYLQKIIVKVHGVKVLDIA